MLLGVIADDFTGASDIANTIAKGLPGEGGLRTAQYIGIPPEPASADIDAGVISLKSRSIPSSDAVSQSLAALSWLLEQGCRQIVFKYCSTFDSTAEGNIGPVGEALARAMGATGVIACPAFPAMGRTVYQGHLFVGNRPLHESGLQNHPINPMTDPDIRRWLELQSLSPVGHVAWQTVQGGPEAIQRSLKDASGRGEVLVVVDALSDEDLLAVAGAVADAVLVTGASGVAMGLPRNFIRRKLATPGASGGGARRLNSKTAILAGSCSGATRDQVRFHEARYPTLAVDVDAVMSGSQNADGLVDFILQHTGNSPLVYSSGTPEVVARLQSKYGAHQVSGTLDGLFAETARRLIAKGVQRLVVAGGETSGAVVSALDFGAMRVGAEIDPGVPVLWSDKGAGAALALKSGNFGSVDFFEKALGRMVADDK